KNHLKIHFNNADAKLEGIGFGMGHLCDYIAQETPVSIVGELGINEWNGNRNVQMMMRDLQVDEWQMFDHPGKKQNEIMSYIQPYERDVVVKSQINLFVTTMSEWGKLV